MPAYVEVWKPSGRELVALTGSRATIGTAPSNTIVFTHDRTVSRLHAVLEDYGTSWTVRDMGSTNGTFVNGEQIHAERALRAGDELRVGHSRLVYRDDQQAEAGPNKTLAADPAPELTRRERDVIDALCRPLFSAEPFPQPASTRQIAAALVITEAAVKQHLLNLYAKFDVPPQGEQRRVALANEAIRRGAVNVATLRVKR
jgi:pSer/pThr/pTyr-binding forkhead associated (FHA) protein